MIHIIEEWKKAPAVLGNGKTNEQVINNQRNMLSFFGQTESSKLIQALGHAAVLRKTPILVIPDLTDAHIANPCSAEELDTVFDQLDQPHQRERVSKLGSIQ